MLDLTQDELANKNLEPEHVRKALQFTLWRLEALRHWQKDDIFAICKGMAETLNIKPKDLFATLFVVITGTANSVSVFDAMQILGPDMSRARIRHASSFWVVFQRRKPSAGIRNTKPSKVHSKNEWK